VQYTTVVALLDGEITVDSFDDARRFAPDAVGLLERTTLHFDDAIARDFDRMHCIVAVTLQDGRVLEEKVEKLSGWVGFPLSAEQRLRKFHGCARRVLDADAAARVVELVERLDSLEDVRGLMAIVRGNG
jgi:2-methylcitrate dehydratase PrpD